METAPLHPRPAAVASTAGGAVPGARAASPSPRGSLAPGDRESRAPAELTLPAPALVRDPKSAGAWRVQGLSYPCSGHSRRDPPPMPGREINSQGTPGRLCSGPSRPAHTSRLTPLAQTLALQVIERLLCANMAGGRVERVGEARRCPEDTIRELYARHRRILGQMQRRALGVAGEFGGLLREVEPMTPGGGDQEDMNQGKGWVGGVEPRQQVQRQPVMRCWEKAQAPLLSKAKLPFLRHPLELQSPIPSYPPSYPLL